MTGRSPDLWNRGGRLSLNEQTEPFAKTRSLPALVAGVSTPSKGLAAPAKAASRLSRVFGGFGFDFADACFADACLGTPKARLGGLPLGRGDSIGDAASVGSPQRLPSISARSTVSTPPGSRGQRLPHPSPLSAKPERSGRHRIGRRCSATDVCGMSAEEPLRQLTPSTVSPAVSPASYSLGSTPSSIPSTAVSSATPFSRRSGGARSFASARSSSCGFAANGVLGGAVSPNFEWKQGPKIGSGGYGTVYKAQDKSDGRMFAVKIARFDGQDDNDNKYREKLQRELDICKDLRHRHIVKCLGHEYTNDRLCIFLEYVAGGSLRQMLNDFGPLDWSQCRKATRGILSGLHYLHTHNPPVVHRDLKGANVLVDLDFCVKLADFGCSKRDVCTKSFTTMGSIPWVAPEVVQQKAGHGRKADVWSLGCVVVEMATAADPWGKGAFDNFMQAMHVIGFSTRTPGIPADMPMNGKTFVEACFTRVPEERPSCWDLLEYDLVRKSSSRAGSRASSRTDHTSV